MIVIMNPSATMRDKSAVIARAEDLGFKVHLSEGKERTIIGIIGNDRVINREQIELMTGVERVVPILKPFKLASREFKASDTEMCIRDSTNVAVQLVAPARLPDLVNTAVLSGTLPDLILHPVEHTAGWVANGALDATAANEVIDRLGRDTFDPAALELSLIHIFTLRV